MTLVQWHNATVGGMDTTGLRLDLPCTREPELFFAESPEDVEQAKAMCRGCMARIACLTGALERREPLGVWGGELLLRGTIVPRKRPRGRPRKTAVAA
jgi:WhiB family redox-sensing transcriptional regulator